MLAEIVKIVARDSTDADNPHPGQDVDPGTSEIFESWSLVIVITLLIISLWTSYVSRQRKIQGANESVLSMVAGMFVGFIIRMMPGTLIQKNVSFSYSYFFNILLPPIILNSGYELNRRNFFGNIVPILLFAFIGTFLATITLGVFLFIWTSLGIDGIDLGFKNAIALGATLSATDPVTILSVFSAHKVDPKLYTIVFGESLLNDAVCIVIFETCQKLRGTSGNISVFFNGVGVFCVTFAISLLIGCLMGILTALLLKHSHIRRYPKEESCLVLLFAYVTYFFSTGCHMSGIVSLLFGGITLKHYACYNMSRRTQITIKFTFQLMAQLAENFVFIYLGLSLFTQTELVFRPLLIIVTTIGACLSRWMAVFPLSRLINRMFSRHRGGEDEIPQQYQFMLFWAGLRGAVGVALAAGIDGEFANELRATVLVVVVLTVIFFGSTTAQALDVLNITTGVPQDQDSDDEFDLETPRHRFSRASPIDADSDQEQGPPETGPSQGITGQWFSKLDSQIIKPILLDTDTN